MMKRAYFLIAFLALLLIVFIYFLGGAASVVPGWHTTIYPAYYSWLFITIIILFFGGIGYWLHIKRVGRLNWLLYIIYCLVTTVTYFFIKFPAVFIKYQQYDQEKVFATARTIMQLLPVATWVLIITQILFIGYVGYLVMLFKKRGQIYF
jgi:hypothetical protein